MGDGNVKGEDRYLRETILRRRDVLEEKQKPYAQAVNSGTS